MRLPFTPTSREIKVSEAITSAGILWVLRRRSPHLRTLRLRSPSQVRLGRVAGPHTVGAYHSSTCSHAVQRRGDVAQPALEEAGREMEGTEVRRNCAAVPSAFPCTRSSRVPATIRLSSAVRSSSSESRCSSTTSTTATTSSVSSPLSVSLNRRSSKSGTLFCEDSNT